MHMPFTTIIITTSFAVLSLFSEHPQNTSVLSELCATLSRLAVRNEFCQDIVDLGGLKFLMSLLADGLDRQVWYFYSKQS